VVVVVVGWGGVGVTRCTRCIRCTCCARCARKTECCHDSPVYPGKQAPCAPPTAAAAGGQRGFCGGAVYALEAAPRACRQSSPARSASSAPTTPREACVAGCAMGVPAPPPHRALNPARSRHRMLRYMLQCAEVQRPACARHAAGPGAAMLHLCENAPARPPGASSVLANRPPLNRPLSRAPYLVRISCRLCTTRTTRFVLDVAFERPRSDAAMKRRCDGATK
jgi:hypothetical protein